jgi:hypothetical protein
MLYWPTQAVCIYQPLQFIGKGIADQGRVFIGGIGADRRNQQ